MYVSISLEIILLQIANEILQLSMITAYFVYTPDPEKEFTVFNIFLTNDNQFS